MPEEDLFQFSVPMARVPMMPIRPVRVVATARRTAGRTTSTIGMP